MGSVRGNMWAKQIWLCCAMAREATGADARAVKRRGGGGACEKWGGLCGRVYGQGCKKNSFVPARDLPQAWAFPGREKGRIIFCWHGGRRRRPVRGREGGGGEKQIRQRLDRPPVACVFGAFVGSRDGERGLWKKRDGFIGCGRGRGGGIGTRFAAGGGVEAKACGIDGLLKQASAATAPVQIAGLAIAREREVCVLLGEGGQNAARGASAKK